MDAAAANEMETAATVQAMRAAGPGASAALRVPACAMPRQSESDQDGAGVMREDAQRSFARRMDACGAARSRRCVDEEE